MWASSKQPMLSTRVFRSNTIEFAPKTLNPTSEMRAQIEHLTEPCGVVQTPVIPALEEVRVDMADMKVERRPIELVTNVGSCVAICIYDSVNKCGGMAHIMLPSSNRTPHEPFPSKFADTAVPTLAETLRRTTKSNVFLLAKIAGGANMFSNLKCSMLNIGAKNVDAVKEALTTSGIKLLAEDVGGTCGRRVSLNVVTGTVNVRSGSGEVKVL